MTSSPMWMTVRGVGDPVRGRHRQPVQLFVARMNLTLCCSYSVLNCAERIPARWPWIAFDFLLELAVSSSRPFIDLHSTTRMTSSSAANTSIC